MTSSRYDESRVAQLLPDRNDSDIPPSVQCFLSACEAATISYRYQDEHWDEPQTFFFEGVVDYWWEEDLEEPRFEMLFHRPLHPDGEWEGYPSYERFCYQQGAIVGYKLREQYGQTETLKSDSH